MSALVSEVRALCDARNGAWWTGAWSFSVDKDAGVYAMARAVHTPAVWDAVDNALLLRGVVCVDAHAAGPAGAGTARAYRLPQPPSAPASSDSDSSTRPQRVRKRPARFNNTRERQPKRVARGSPTLAPGTPSEGGGAATFTAGAPGSADPAAPLAAPLDALSPESAPLVNPAPPHKTKRRPGSARRAGKRRKAREPDVAGLVDVYGLVDAMYSQMAQQTSTIASLAMEVATLKDRSRIMETELERHRQPLAAGDVASMERAVEEKDHEQFADTLRRVVKYQKACTDTARAAAAKCDELAGFMHTFTSKARMWPTELDTRMNRELLRLHVRQLEGRGIKP